MDNWLIFQYSLIFAQDESDNAKAVKPVGRKFNGGIRRPGSVVVQQWCDTGRQSNPGDGCPGVRS